MHAEIGSRAAMHRAWPAPLADPLHQWLASQSEVDKAEGKQGLAGLRETASRSRHVDVGEGNDQGRGSLPSIDFLSTFQKKGDVALNFNSQQLGILMPQPRIDLPSPDFPLLSHEVREPTDEIE